MFVKSVQNSNQIIENRRELILNTNKKELIYLKGYLINAFL